MKIILAFLLIGSVASADDRLFTKGGQITVAGDDHGGRSITDWSDLAKGAKSVQAKLEYLTKLGAILNSYSTHQIDLAGADKALIRFAALAIAKDVKDERRQDTPETIHAPGAEARRSAMLCLRIVGDESCLPTLFARLSDEAASDREYISAGEAIAGIGGKKAIDGLSKLVRSAGPRELTASRLFHKPVIRGSYNRYALEALGQIGSDEAQAAIRSIAALAAKTDNEFMAKDARTAMMSSQERQAAVEDAKARAAKPAK